MIRRDEDVSSIMEKGNFFVSGSYNEPEAVREVTELEKSTKRVLLGAAL